MSIDTDTFLSTRTQETSPEIHMLRLISGALVTQALYAFASLGIPDLLRNEPRSAQDLAEQTRSDPATLSRLLRFLSTLEVVKACDTTTFALTRLGRTLCRRPRSAIHDSTLLLGAPFYWATVGGLLRQVKTGENAFQSIFGQEFFAYLAENEELERTFGAAMESSTQLGIPGILSLYDFSPFRDIMDVGGGKGALLKGILKRYPHVRGTLYDSESVLRQVTVDPEIEPRLTRVAGSFFTEVPPGADLLVLRRVLHDWSDAKAVQILRNCRKSMRLGDKLLVIELSPEQSLNNWAGSDLLMMVLQDGKERTGRELHTLLASADLQTVKVCKSQSPYWIFEAVAH